jgi:hypothetical protein
MMDQRVVCTGMVVCFLAFSLPAAAHEVGVATDNPPAFGGVMPELSADGESIALSYQGAIWRMPRAGGVITRLTRGRGFDVEPTWSRDGKRIAFIQGMSFGNGNLAVIDAHSGQPVKLQREISVLDKLHFDRAGRVLGLFQPPGEKVRLAWFDLETGELTNAIRAESWPGHSPGTPGLARQRFSLSHDDRWLAVVSVADEPGEQTGNRGPQSDLWRVPLDGGKPELVVHWPARIHHLCWRADDRALIIATERGGVHHDLWEVPLENAADARKISFGQADESSPSVSADGSWLLYTDNRHGSTMLVLRELRDRSDQEQIVAPTRYDFGSPEGSDKLNGWVKLKVTEGVPAAETTARVVLRHAGGKFHAPPGALYRVLGTDMHFYLHDHQQIDLPVGEYTVVATRGPEHRTARKTFEIRERESTEVTLHLERWTNQRSQGWVSGENHIHANYGYGHWYNSPTTMRLQCEGEDLTVANFMVANSDGDGVFDREFFIGRPDPLSTDRTILYWNEEFRSTIWGHMTLLNLQHLVSPIYTGFARTTHPYDVPTNADIADHTHEEGGHVNYTHPAHNLQDPYDSAYSAKEMPVDVALGKIDSIDIMGTGHEANLPVWYRLLNCGLRVPASAGTDCFLNRIVSRLPGSDRVYVHCQGKFSYRDWIDNLRAGRTFVTNGPMLRFTVDGHEAGSTVKLSGSGDVEVVASAEAQFPVEKLEVLVGGVVKAEASPGDNSQRISFSQKVPIDRSGWIAVRVKGQRAPGQQSAAAFAHTSPVYIEVADRPIHSTEDAAYFIKWIQRLRDDVRKRNRIPAAKQVHVEQQMSQALEFYGRLAKEAAEKGSN